jgi:hypothetical protein
MAKNSIPSGTWIRQALSGNQVKMVFIPSRHKSKPSFGFYDKVKQSNQDEHWRKAFKNFPNVDIDKGQVILRVSADKTSVHLVWIPDDPAPKQQPVIVIHPFPPIHDENSKALGEYALCVLALGAEVTPPVAMAVCAPLLLIPV